MTLRLVRTLDSLRIETVLDVGANVFATLLRSAGYLRRIVSFEPLLEAFTNAGAPGKPRCPLGGSQVAIGERSGSSTIHVSRNSYSPSLLTMNQTHLAAAPGSTVVVLDGAGNLPSEVAAIQLETSFVLLV
jgi:hypothetical protein